MPTLGVSRESWPLDQDSSSPQPHHASHNGPSAHRTIASRRHCIRRRRRCGTRGAMRNVRPRSPPSSGPARCRQKRCQYRTQPLAAKPTSFCISNTPTCPPSRKSVPSSLLPRPDTPPGKSPITPRYARGWMIARGRNSLLEDFRVGRCAAHFMLSRVLVMIPQKPGKSGGDHSREGFMDRTG